MIAPLALCLAVGACASDLPSGNPGIDLRGNWSYVASQATPQADFRGSLVITSQAGDEFSGNIEYQETDAQGTVRNRAGVVSGRLITADAVDFDAIIAEEPYRHVGRIVGDSLTGSWVSSGQVPVSGRFALRRTTP